MNPRPAAGRHRAPADGSVRDAGSQRLLPANPPIEVGHGSGAVVIPAHNEAGVIAGVLRNLAPLSVGSSVEVIVVCNGCTDDTAAIARESAGVTVLEIGVASKTAALNAGDEHASGWPRFYLDADIDVSPEAVLAVFAGLERPGICAARPCFVYDTEGSAAPVEAYYRARSRIPSPLPRLWGAGGYAVSQAGHSRFAAFPAVTADDSWFDAQFEAHEKRIIPTTPVVVRAPRDVASLLAVLTRQRRGQVELGIPASTASRARSLLLSIRGPRTLADVAWYVLFTALARRRSRAALLGRVQVWESDRSRRSESRSHR